MHCRRSIISGIELKLVTGTGLTQTSTHKTPFLHTLVSSLFFFFLQKIQDL